MSNMFHMLNEDMSISNERPCLAESEMLRLCVEACVKLFSLRQGAAQAVPTSCGSRASLVL